MQSHVVSHVANKRKNLLMQETAVEFVDSEKQKMQNFSSLRK